MKAFRLMTVILLVAILLFSGESVWAQCVMCKGAINEKVNYSESNLGNGLNTGILYLMSFPYIIFGVIAYFWYKESRKNTAKRNEMANSQA